MGAIVKDHERKVKLEIADFPLFPRLAILDPEIHAHAAAAPSPPPPAWMR